MTDFDDFDSDPDFVRVSEPDRFVSLAELLEIRAHDKVRYGMSEQEASVWADELAEVIDLRHPGFNTYWRKNFSIIWF